ncbi:hypothetical protein BHE74_00037541 [Ensete ventricosum]|nr:hypothetical protein BHE74_00037541 [Ensete ventricosum]
MGVAPDRVWFGVSRAGISGGFPRESLESIAIEEDLHKGLVRMGVPDVIPLTLKLGAAESYGESVGAEVWGEGMVCHVALMPHAATVKLAHHPDASTLDANVAIINLAVELARTSSSSSSRCETSCQEEEDSQAGKIAELLHPKIGNQQKNTQIVKSQKGGGGGGEGPKWYKNLKFPRFKNLKLPFKKEKEVVKFDILPKEESGDVKKKTDGGGGEGVGVQVQNKGGTTSPVTIIHGGVMSPEMTAGGNPYHHPQQQRMTMMNGGQDSVGYGYGHAEYVPPPPPPQEVSYSTTMFSDENPNNCSVM